MNVIFFSKCEELDLKTEFNISERNKKELKKV